MSAAVLNSCSVLVIGVCVERPSKISILLSCRGHTAPWFLRMGLNCCTQGGVGDEVVEVVDLVSDDDTPVIDIQQVVIEVRQLQWSGLPST